MPIRPSDAEHNDAFMAQVWPEVDAPLGIQWDEVRGYLRSEDASGITRGAATFRRVGGVGELLQILVRPEHHRDGIGGELLQAFEAECRAQGCHKLRLETAEYQARAFYERHGWHVAATLSDDRFHYALYVMEKPLPSP